MVVIGLVRQLGWGLVSSVDARYGDVRKVKAWQFRRGMVSHGDARLGKLRFGSMGQVRSGVARSGGAW